MSEPVRWKPSCTLPQQRQFSSVMRYSHMMENLKTLLFCVFSHSEEYLWFIQFPNWIGTTYSLQCIPLSTWGILVRWKLSAYALILKPSDLMKKCSYLYPKSTILTCHACNTHSHTQILAITNTANLVVLTKSLHCILDWICPAKQAKISSGEERMVMVFTQFSMLWGRTCVVCIHRAFLIQKLRDTFCCLTASFLRGSKTNTFGKIIPLHLFHTYTVCPRYRAREICTHQHCLWLYLCNSFTTGNLLKRVYTAAFTTWCWIKI